MSLTDEDLSQVRDVVVSAIQELVLPRFDQHDARFDAQDARFDALDHRLTRLEADIKAVEIDMRQVKSTLGKLDGRSEGLEADVKELYSMVAAQKPTYTDKQFANLSTEQRVIQMYEAVRLIAREMGITLPN